jgi:hypothetical protein
MNKGSVQARAPLREKIPITGTTPATAPLSGGELGFKAGIDEFTVA